MSEQGQELSPKDKDEMQLLFKLDLDDEKDRELWQSTTPPDEPHAPDYEKDAFEFGGQPDPEK